jgi:hypothetical protein
MANTGFLNPVSAFSVSAGIGGNRAWTSAGNTGSIFSAARVSDNARVLVNDLSASVVPFPFFAAFSPGIPANSEVQGFTLRYERRANSTAVSANETWIRLVSGAGAGVQMLGTTANANTANLSATDTYFSAGGSGSMFGLSTADASSSRVNGLGFAVNIRYGTGTTLTSAIAQIDHMQLQIHYTAQAQAVSGEPFSAEFGADVGPLRLSKNVGAQSSEFDAEVQSPSLIKSLSALSAEFAHEAASPGVSQPGTDLSVDGPEFSGEYRSSSISLNATVAAQEFVHETGSPLMSRNVIPSQAELGYEITSPSLGAAALVAPMELGNEHAGVGLALNIGAINSEFAFSATSPSLGLVSSIRPAFIEFGHEARSLGWGSSYYVKVFGAEFGRSAASTQQTASWTIQRRRKDRSWRRYMKARNLWAG